MKKVLLITFTLLIGISTNAQGWWSSKKVKGNGKVITEKRPVDDFDDVSVGGSFDVILVDGKEGQVTIEGEENIMPYIITEVKGGTLKIKHKDNVNIRTTRRLTVTVPFEKIDGISLGGSGNVIAKKRIKSDKVSFAIGGSGDIEADVDANSVNSSIGGSGSIKLKGNTENFKCSIAGSGSVKAYDLKTDNLKASIAGSGSVQTSVTHKIDANVVGSGSVYYKGNPKYIDTNSVGSGDVIKRD
ncbi:head GIN domain-containing protein [Tenacibaculum sp. IB213877]|uniref:head GIN domain-containing protein n=1 Tax=Tenacibaculum sp. IB213877 TaxID=3097351 RepID=UPI002A5A0AB4|nr:head GIN domain-containing protein [Tenacibaculum sp. IB213877]MDY0779709.1 head GIN domain-containing protein [Tenacibaculum sp. IB213877]